MASNVVSFGGGPVPGEPDPLVIKVLEDALELARQGVCIGVGIARVNSDGAVQWSISANQVYPLIASINFMLHDILSTKQKERDADEARGN